MHTCMIEVGIFRELYHTPPGEPLTFAANGYIFSRLQNPVADEQTHMLNMIQYLREVCPKYKFSHVLYRVYMHQLCVHRSNMTVDM